MGKALIVYGPDSTHDSGEEMGLLGSSSSTTVTNSQYEATEAATFSGLARQFLTGGSLQNDLRFLVNAASGNQLATRSGPGYAEDSLNTDVLAAGDLFNAAAIDTGTSPTGIIFIRSNVEFASGHGNFHGAVAPLGVAYTASSAIRYIALAGLPITGGSATFSGSQWKVRGYSTCDAIQVRVLANARVNATTVRLNVNGSDVGSTLTIGAGVTGLVKITGLGEDLAPGDSICLSATFGVGTQTLNISLWGVTLKSGTSASEVWAQAPSGFIRAASATATVCCVGGILQSSAGTEAQTRLKAGFHARAANLRANLTLNTYTASCTVQLIVNGSVAITHTIAAGASGWQENSTTLLGITDTDEISYRITGGTSGSATFNAIGLTFGDPLAVTPQSSDFGWGDSQEAYIISSFVFDEDDVTYFEIAFDGGVFVSSEPYPVSGGVILRHSLIGISQGEHTVLARACNIDGCGSSSDVLDFEVFDVPGHITQIQVMAVNPVEVGWEDNQPLAQLGITPEFGNEIASVALTQAGQALTVTPFFESGLEVESPLWIQNYVITRCTFGSINSATLVTDGGFSWMTPVFQTGVPSDPAVGVNLSPMRVFEDGVELGPAHSGHQNIRDFGAGRFSHKGGIDQTNPRLRFSSSDNSAIPSNGRVYTYCVPVTNQSLASGFEITITSATLVSLEVGSAEFGREDASPVITQEHNISQCPSVALNLSTITTDSGFSWLIPAQFQTGVPANTTAFTTRSSLRLFENGVELGPAHSGFQNIRDFGNGRFNHFSGIDNTNPTLRFSASDNSAPETNGKTYTYCVPVTNQNFTEGFDTSSVSLENISSNVDPSEYDWECDSVFIQRTVNLVVDASEYEWECDSAFIQHVINVNLDADSAEFGWDGSSALIARDIIAQEVEIGFESESPSLLQTPVFYAGEFEEGWEGGSPALTQVHNISQCPSVLLVTATGVTSDTGFAWITSQKSGFVGDNNSTAEIRSPTRLFEDGVELGPAHQLHANIRTLGLGRFSNSSNPDGSTERIRFSTSDNTDPTTNGRVYTLCIPITDQNSTYGWDASKVNTTDLVVTPELEEGWDASSPALTQVHNLTPCIQVAVSMATVINDTGFCWLHPAQFITGVPADTATYLTRSPLRLFEDGVELGPANSGHANIRNLGLGRFSHFSGADNTNPTLRFSSSDNSDPTTNARAYTYCVPLTDQNYTDGWEGESVSLSEIINASVDELEEGFEIESIAVSQLGDLAPDASEYGWEPDSISVSQEHVIAVQEFEEGFEVDSASLLPIIEFAGTESEYEWEVDSVRLPPEDSLSVDESEYGWEDELLIFEQESNIVVQEYEDGFEVVSLPLPDIVVVTPEFGYEDSPPDAVDFILNLIVDSLEFDYEIQEGAPEVVIFGDSIVVSFEEGFEISSASLKYFQAGITPSDRRMTIPFERRTFRVNRDHSRSH